MKKFTNSDRQLVINAIAIDFDEKRKSKPRLLAFINNDTDFIKKFNEQADVFNKRAELGSWEKTVYFDEQLSWDIDFFKTVKKIREYCC